MNAINLNGIIYFDNFSTPFVEITNKEIPNIRPGYYINIFGTVYNSVSKRFKNPILDSDKRYYTLEFKRIDNSRVSIKAHRLIMIIFNYIDGFENLEVNHKDGNKYNNNLTNLEWCNHSYNVQHAYDNNLMKCGENHRFSILTEKQVREICEILQNSPRYVSQFSEIANMYNVNKIAILEIAYGYTWTQVSREYNINYNYRLNDRFTKEQVHQICNIFQNNSKFGFLYCVDIICRELNLQRNQNLLQKLRKLYNKNSGYFDYITKLYNW